MTTIRMTASLDGPRSIERDLPGDWWQRAPEWRERWLGTLREDLITMLAEDTIDCSTEPYDYESLTGAKGLADPGWTG